MLTDPRRQSILQNCTELLHAQSHSTTAPRKRCPLPGRGAHNKRITSRIRIKTALTPACLTDDVKSKLTISNHRAGRSTDLNVGVGLGVSRGVQQNGAFDKVWGGLET